MRRRLGGLLLYHLDLPFALGYHLKWTLHQFKLVFIMTLISMVFRVISSGHRTIGCLRNEKIDCGGILWLTKANGLGNLTMSMY